MNKFKNSILKTDLIRSFSNKKAIEQEPAHVGKKNTSSFPPNNVLPLHQNDSSMDQVDFLTVIVNSFPGNKLIVDQKGQVLWFQPSANSEEVCHLEGDVMNKNITEIYPEYILEGVFANIQQAFLHNQTQSFEYPMTGIDKADHFYLLKVDPISDDQVFLNIQNITRRKVAEEELRVQAQALELNNKQLRKAQASNEQLENFAYIASHDLREPLRTINNFADLLNRNYKDQLDEDGQTYLHFIVNRSQQMSYLIDDLLTYSRVNTENHNIEDVNFDEIIEDVQLSLMQVINESKAIIQTENKLKGNFKGNPVKMKQLFQNLIANAIKFRKKDVPCKIIIKATDQSEVWRFDVIDNGIGIRKEFQRQIFVLFKKLHATSSYPGTGLGLAICNKIIEQHSGNIWVDSEPNQGSTFSFTIQKELDTKL